MAQVIAYGYFDTKIKGVTFDDPLTGKNRQEIIKKHVKPGTTVTFAAEPDNPVDGQEPQEEPPESLFRIEDVGVEQESGGVTLRVSTVSIVPFEDMPPDFRGNEFVTDSNYWADVETVLALKAHLTNGTDQTISVYPDQGTIVVGNQQRGSSVWLSEAVGGDIYSGVEMAGMVLFGLKNPVDVSAIKSIRYIVGAPLDEEWEDMGPGFDLTIPLE
ncbi:MAG: hypothetical protein U9R25_11260 [Chloroflexota bacterium]|nr:hypothetical protein [Chloroflexota bacterium]